MMWQIIYTIDNHYRDQDNRFAINTGELHFSTGETIDEAVENLISILSNDGSLEYVIDTEILELDSYDDCFCLRIVSIGVIKENAVGKIFEHPLFRKPIGS